MTTTWPDFLATLDAERADLPAARPMRAMAEEFALRTLTLLFPQFARGERTTTTSVRADAVALESLLLESLEPLVPHAADVVRAFTASLPGVHAMLREDVNAILAGDPAAESEEEVVLAYPGFLATAVHRFAHELYQLRVPVFPRVVSEWAHRETGIDIHPGATIGHSFAIDHGTGLVIGETSVIGDRVRVYQGVTLGALAVSKRLAHTKRHPTIGNDVVIYANATILGGNTTVGDGSIIGGNVWMTGSVPPRSVVQFSSRVEKRAPDDDGLEFHI
ncbi:MAG: serine O-acetyltransferase EpsC [Gemmatimonadota bacterium]